jgi:hypothetical protein
MPSRVVLAGVVATIYILACCCPALRLDHYYPGSNTPQSSETWFGWTALFLGWLGIMVGSVAWLANFVLGLTVVFLLSGLRWASLICSSLTVLLSLDFFPLFSAKIPTDEGGVGSGRPATAGNWRLALVCQHRGCVCGCADFVLSAENRSANRRE